MKQLYSLHKRDVKFLIPVPNIDYKQKCCALKLLPLDKQLLLNKCVLMQKVVHGEAQQYLKDLKIPSECLHVHGNKQTLPRTRIDIVKTSFSFSCSLAWNSLAHHLRYPMELKTFKRKAFRLEFVSCLDTSLYFFRFLLLIIIIIFYFFFACRTTWYKMYRIFLFSLPCSCKVSDLYFIKIFFIYVFSWNIYSFSLSSWTSFFFFFFSFFLFFFIIKNKNKIY